MVVRDLKTERQGLMLDQSAILLQNKFCNFSQNGAN